MLTVLVLIESFLCHYHACFYHHLKLTFWWKWWLCLKLVSYKGFFAFCNCRYFFSFSLLSCIVKNRVGSGFKHVGLPSGKWTEHTRNNFLAQSLLFVWISVLPIFFFQYRSLGTYVTWLKSHLRILSICLGICNCYHMFPHSKYCVSSTRIALLFIFTKKI